MKQRMNGLSLKNIKHVFSCRLVKTEGTKQMRNGVLFMTFFDLPIRSIHHENRAAGMMNSVSREDHLGGIP